MTGSFLRAASGLALALLAASCAATPADAPAPVVAASPGANPAMARGDVGRPSEADLAAAAKARADNPNKPAPWWEEASRQPDSFYRSAEGKRMAENILSWQDRGAGWPLMNTTREPFTGDVSKAGPWGEHAALIKATVNEMRFLARGYRATKDERYEAAVTGGLNYILSAQYPSGGWPHSYPVRDDYSRYATFNDDMMPDLMTLLDEAATSPDFELLGKPDRERAKAAFDRGVDFVLRSQIRVNGRLTAWPQQCDAVTYEPKPARTFEPAAISGGESAGVLAMLMRVPKPSPAVIASVEAGVQWYRDAQIDGLKLTYANGDRVVTPDASASPLWARFYQIGTGKPIFAGRDGVIRYSLAEIEKERRGGYGWYNTNGSAVFERYAAWKNERRWDAQAATNVDEAKVGTYTLPDLLKTQAGAAVRTKEQWEKVRRPEIMKLLEQYQEGVTPSQTIAAKVEVIERDKPVMGGLSKRTQVRIRFPDHPDGPVIRVMLNVPAKAKGPTPTLLYLGFNANLFVNDEPGIDEGQSWSAALKASIPDRDAARIGTFDLKTFVQRGYAVANVFYGDIYPDFQHDNTLGVPTLFGPPPKVRRPDDWGANGAWSWGLSRVMDWLVAEPEVDAKKVALAGVSRIGKAVLWAGAQDQRFSLVIPWVSGEGGASISRRFYGETVADLTNPARYPYWFAPRYQDYAFKVDELPVDGHFLLAMIAPRPVLQIVGTEDTWSDPKGEWVAAQAAEKVWQLYGKSEKAKTYPAPDKAMLGDMGFLLHKGPHGALPIDYVTVADFMDLHFGKPR